MLLTILDKLINRLIILFMAGIVVAVTWQVFSRYFLAEPSAISGELSRFLLIWIGLLGATYCYRHNSHLSLNVVTQKFSAANQHQVAIFGHLMVLLFASLVLVTGGLQLVQMTLESGQVSPVMGIKMGYIYGVIPLSGLVIVIYAVDKITGLFRSGGIANTPNSDEADK